MSTVQRRQSDTASSWDTPVLPARRPAHSHVVFNYPDRVSIGDDAADIAELYTVEGLGRDSLNSESNAEVATGGAEGNALKRPAAPSVTRVSPGRRPARILEVVRQWEGVVTEVSEKGFAAELHDVQNSGDPQRIQMEFSLWEVQTGDRDLVETGAVFSWTVGREFSPQRTVELLKFWRLPAWTKSDLGRIRIRAAELREQLGIDTPAD